MGTVEIIVFLGANARALWDTRQGKTVGPAALSSLLVGNASQFNYDQETAWKCGGD